MSRTINFISDAIDNYGHLSQAELSTLSDELSALTTKIEMGDGIRRMIQMNALQTIPLPTGQVYFDFPDHGHLIYGNTESYELYDFRNAPRELVNRIPWIKELARSNQPYTLIVPEQYVTNKQTIATKRFFDRLFDGHNWNTPL